MRTFLAIFFVGAGLYCLVTSCPILGSIGVLLGLADLVPLRREHVWDHHGL